MSLTLEYRANDLFKIAAPDLAKTITVPGAEIDSLLAAARANNGDAQYDLGLAYLNGDFRPRRRGGELMLTIRGDLIALAALAFMAAVVAGAFQ